MASGARVQRRWRREAKRARANLLSCRERSDLQPKWHAHPRPRDPPPWGSLAELVEHLELPADDGAEEKRGAAGGRSAWGLGGLAELSENALDVVVAGDEF